MATPADMPKTKPNHTYISPEQRKVAEDRQSLVIQGKGMAKNYNPIGFPKKKATGKR